MKLVSLSDVRTAAANLAGVVVRTPLLPMAAESSKSRLTAGGLWLKPESLQPVGSFKLRGAYNAVASVPADRRTNGVVTHSSGNHAQALAYAARAFGIPCVVVMPEVATPAKVAATRALGARVELVPAARRLSRMREIAERDAMTPVPPFDDAAVIAGQGTIGLEILADLSDVDYVLVPIGGGGLASGVATAVKALSPQTAVIGVEPQLAGDAADSLRRGELVEWPIELTYRTIADGLRVGGLSELTFAHLQARLDGIVTVTEDEILDTMRALAYQARLVVEPSGAVATAAYLYHRAELPGGQCVAIVSGGNPDPAVFARALGPALPEPAGST
jgi:threonine dehydratase